MPSKKLICCMVAITLASPLLAFRASRAAEVKSGLLLGYGGGAGSEISLTLSQFVERSPLRVRMAMGYATMDPGDPALARRVFINGATDGTPEKSGHEFTWRMDFLAATSGTGETGWSLYGGPRYSRFTGSFRYVGGDEEFDVRCHQWGLGGGAEYRAPISPGVGLRVGGGADYYFDGMIEGHDAEYNPDNQNVNSRENYNYQDAKTAINQPSLQFRALVGVEVRLGAQ